MREPSERWRADCSTLPEHGRFDLLYDYAQPYSITLICELLGVPTDRHRDLLDWSHRIVKMPSSTRARSRPSGERLRRSSGSTCSS